MIDIDYGSEEYSACSRIIDIMFGNNHNTAAIIGILELVLSTTISELTRWHVENRPEAPADEIANYFFDYVNDHSRELAMGALKREPSNAPKKVSKPAAALIKAVHD